MSKENNNKKKNHNEYFGNKKAKNNMGFNQATNQNKNYRSQNRGR